MVTAYGITNDEMRCREGSSCCDQLKVAISVFPCGVNEIFALLGCCAALISSYFLAFWDNLSVQSSRVRPDCLILEDGTDRLSRNFGK